MVSLANFAVEQDKTYWIAYSGGLDSHVLLHLFAKLHEQSPLKLKAIHVHHGLSPHANQWAEHCAQVCAALKIDFVLKKINIPTEKGESPEDLARQFRYAVFKELLTVNDLLLTAHHQNDQAETVLLQLLRGAGPKGLAAMPPIKKLGDGFHARPLLSFSREQLKQYAEQYKLQWIEDESNAQVHFTRNFLRHQVLPLLQTRWPTVTKTLSRAAENCADAQLVLDEMIQTDLSQAAGSVANTLSVTYLKKLSIAHQRLVLREWLRGQSVAIPSAKKMHHIVSDMLYANEDKMPYVQWANVALRRYRNNLYICRGDRRSPDDAMNLQRGQSREISWDLQEPLTIPGIGLLATTNQSPKSGLEQVTIRFRQGGETCRLPGRTCHHELKKLFQEWGIPPWERDRVPLIYVGDELAAIVGYAVCEGYGLMLDH